MFTNTSYDGVNGRFGGHSVRISDYPLYSSITIIGFTMLFIVLSALSSIFVALLLKSARARKMDTLQLIAWNYATGLILCGVVLKPSITAMDNLALPWPWLTLLAVLLPSVFIIYSLSLDKAGIIRTEIAQRLSLLIALAAAFTFLGDTLTPLKLIGIALGVGAIVLLALNGSQTKSSAKYASLLLLGVWAGYGIVDVTLKQIAASGVPLAVALSISFLIAGLIMFTVVLFRHHTSRSTLKFGNVYLGIFLGLLNFANIVYYLKAHQTFAAQPAIVFASMNILVVTLGILAGRFIYKEALHLRTSTALILCFSAIGFLTLSQWH